MTASALGMVLVAACAHAAWNLAAKRVGDGGALFVWLYYSISAVVCAPVALVFSLLTHPDPRWIWLGAAALTAALHVGYGVVLQRGYAVGDMSVVYPTARGTGPLLAALVAVALLGERPGTVGLVGALLVIAGVVVIGSAGARAAGARGRRLGLAYGLATGVFIAGYTLWDAHAVTALAIPPLVYFTIAAALQGVFLLPRAVADRSRLPALLRGHGREALVIGVLSPLAYVLVLYALRMAPVALVAPARESSIVLGSLLGLVVLREGHAPRKLAGAGLVFAGIVAIGLS